MEGAVATSHGGPWRSTQSAWRRGRTSPPWSAGFVRGTTSAVAGLARGVREALERPPDATPAAGELWFKLIDRLFVEPLNH